MRRVPAAGILRVVDRVELLRRPLRVVLDHELQRAQHRHPARRGLVQMLADRMVEHRDIDEAVGAGDADPAGKIADRRRRHAAPAQPGQGRHARIVPAVDPALADQLGQKPLRQHRVVDVEPRELVLPRPRRHRQIVEQPVVERPVILEFERAEANASRPRSRPIGHARNHSSDRCTICSRCADARRAGCGTAPGRAD